jgi:hypothetical protein
MPALEAALGSMDDEIVDGGYERVESRVAGQCSHAGGRHALGYSVECSGEANGTQIRQSVRSVISQKWIQYFEYIIP